MLLTGMQVLVGNDDGDVILYSDSLVEVRKFAGHDDIVSAIAPSPSNYSEFASVGYDGSLFVWDWRSANPNSPTYTVEAHHGIINDVAYDSNNGNILTTVGSDGFARVWDTRNKDRECSQLFDVGQICTSVLFHDEYTIIIGTEDGRICVIDQRQSSEPVYCVAHRSRIRRLRRFDNDVFHDHVISVAEDTTTCVMHMHNVVQDGGMGDQADITDHETLQPVIEQR